MDYAHTYPPFWSTEHIPNLAKVLPPSIKSVRLLAGAWWEEPAVLESLFSIASYHRWRIPALKTVLVERGTYKVGNAVVADGQDPVAWKFIGNVVRRTGFTYKEHDRVWASWTDDLRRTTPMHT
jgi:hypothetical protein